VEHLHDVWTPERRRGARFSAKTTTSVLRSGPRRIDELDGYPGTQFDVFSHPNGAHPAATEQVQQPILPVYYSAKGSHSSSTIQTRCMPEVLLARLTASTKAAPIYSHWRTSTRARARRAGACFRVPPTRPRRCQSHSWLRDRAA